MIYVNPNWTYRESVEHIQTLKDEYRGILSSFSMWETGKKAYFREKTRDKFYALNLIEWQIEHLWKYMNDYIDYESLKSSVCQRKKNQNRQK